MLGWLERKLAEWAWNSFDDPAECDHKWHVVGTDVSDISLMLECYHCGSHGHVSDPTKEEWSKAYDAPNKSYRWLYNKRAILGPRMRMP